MVLRQGVLVSIVLRLVDDGIDHGDEANKAHHRSYLDTAETEDVGIKSLFRRTAATHQNEADDHDGKTDSQQREVGTVECIISFIHILFNHYSLFHVSYSTIIQYVFETAEEGMKSCLLIKQEIFH